MAPDSDSSQTPAELVDEEQLGSPGIDRLARPAASVALLGLLVGGAGYAALVAGEEALVVPVVGVEVDVLDWMYGLALAFVSLQLVVPAVRAPDRTRRRLRRLGRSRFAVGCLGVLGALAVAGSLAPVVLSPPAVDPQYAYQPPIGTTVESYYPVDCAGAVVDGHCRGTGAYPLGSDAAGKDVLALTLYGVHTSLQVAVTATVLVVALGTTVGTLAAYVGGWVDELLMRYVDVQQAIPAFFVYLLAGTVFGTDLELMVLVFGLLSWGGLARLVRSDVLGQRDAGYVRVAEAAGGGPLHVVRRHLLPNASGTVLTAATLTAPKFVLYEAALSYLGLGDQSPTAVSLGGEVASGLDQQFAVWWEVWWVWLVPAVALAALVFATNVVGDALRDALDPRVAE